MFSANSLSIRGFMISLHQMHDFTPWFGPNIQGVKMILDAMHEAKLNTLLFEYEAFYPWGGTLNKIACSNHFSPQEIQQIIDYAAGCGIEIIPLVQVLGHVYHILIHPEYANCAEDPLIPQQLCPLSEATHSLARELIDDTIRLHPESKYIHLGGDECEQLGQCPRCKKFAAQYGKGKLFMEYFKFATDYVLSKHKIPILWHDVALRNPENLGMLDSRVIYQFWNYGDASHGSIQTELKKLRCVISPDHIIGSPGARAEMPHGRLNISPSLVAQNICEMNQVMTEINARGTILTDWPDTGCSYLASLMPLALQGEISYDTPNFSLAQFKRNYALKRFGFSCPELFDKLDLFSGSTSFARGFQYLQAHELNRYARKKYSFEAELQILINDYKSGDGEIELYRLINRYYATISGLDLLQENYHCCQKNHLEYRWYILLGKLTKMFLEIDIGYRKDCFMRKYFREISPDLVARWQSHEYLVRALQSWDELETEFFQIHQEISLEKNLQNHLAVFFPADLKRNIQAFLN